MEYGSDLSVSKLLSMVDQSLFDCPVSCQDHHLLRSKVDCEHWSIFFGQLKRWRKGKVQLTVLYKKWNGMEFTDQYKHNKQRTILFKTDITHINKGCVEFIEIHLKQVTKQGKRIRSWRLPLVFGAEAGVKKVEDQQAHNGHQQGDCSGGLEKIFQHDCTSPGAIEAINSI